MLDLVSLNAVFKNVNKKTYMQERVNIFEVLLTEDIGGWSKNITEIFKESLLKIKSAKKSINMLPWQYKNFLKSIVYSYGQLQSTVLQYLQLLWPRKKTNKKADKY